MRPSRLREMRYRYGYTQQEVADQLSISRSAYSTYETGRHDFPLESLILLADFYDVSLDYLIFRSNIPKHEIPLSSEELMLLKGFSQLTPANRDVLFTLLHALTQTQSSQGEAYPRKDDTDPDSAL